MSADRIRLLIDALRSGDFTQASGRLRVDDSYCCLGVACEVYKETTGDGEWCDNSGDDDSEFVPSTGQSDDLTLPETVQEWFGFVTAGGAFEVQDRYGNELALTDLNDAGFTFEQIADVIEYEPKGLLR